MMSKGKENLMLPLKIQFMRIIFSQTPVQFNVKRLHNGAESVQGEVAVNLW